MDDRIGKRIHVLPQTDELLPHVGDIGALRIENLVFILICRFRDVQQLLIVVVCAQEAVFQVQQGEVDIGFVAPGVEDHGAEPRDGPDQLVFHDQLSLRRALSNSRMLSSDVSAGFDPNFPSVNEKKNAAYLGRGLVFNKYTGSRGKSGSNDASAEYMASMRSVMDGAGVAWQTAELGRVDEGGGGTIAYISANYGMSVIDSGIAVLSMHAPWEVSSKADIYEGKKGYVAFLLHA